MGMYTELHFNAQLKSDCPKEVIDILNFMLSGAKEPYNAKTPDHDFFKTDRWSWMLVSDSYYFDADTHSTLRFDNISKSYYLCIRCNLKNYSDEINLFVDWIDQYLDKISGEFLGFSRYEETENPILIYKK